jgi:Protein of unknown function (DUF3147)
MTNVRVVEARISSLKDVKPHEWAVRFLFGGACTVIAGLIAKQFGPAVGGLFLAFPAIFPAGASLLESHEKRKMVRAGLDGTNQGRTAASVDSAGASIGCIGLVGFAITLWRGLPGHNAYLVITAGTIVWAALSVVFWFVRKSRLLRPASHKRQESQQ